MIETRGDGYALASSDLVDAGRFEALVHAGRAERAHDEPAAAKRRYGDALALWRGEPFGELADWPGAGPEIARLGELRRQAEEEAIDARLEDGEAANVVADLEVLVAAEPLREHRWAQLMRALSRSGRQADALRAFQRARSTLVTELGIEPGPELHAIEQAVIAQSGDAVQTSNGPGARVDRLPSGVVTFVLTDIESSTRLWEEHPADMPDVLSLHDEILAHAVADAGGTLLKARGEGDSTFSVFVRATDAVVAAIAAQDALERAVWPAGIEPLVRVAVHSGEALERDGDYFGPTVNRAARLRSLCVGSEIVASHAAAELVRDHLPDGADLVELGAQRLRGLDRPERVFSILRPHARLGGDDGRVNPYPGLRPFEVEDSERFFGRDAIIDAVINRLASTRFVAVVGASGSGKSSLVRAGVTARLRPVETVVVITPGPHPARRLEFSSPPQVVVVDQFEELFTSCDDVDERNGFLDRLVLLDAKVVIAVRADFYGRCAEHHGLAERVTDSTLLLGPMQPAELRAATEGPARISGGRFEPGLVEEILSDLAGEPGALPLLSHALLETWKRRRGRTMTIDGYHAAGGVRGAISQTAEEMYATLDGHRQAVARDIFIRLTEVRDGGNDVGRRAGIDELESLENAGAVAPVLDTLANARLVTIGDGSVAIAHTALISEWPRLRGWLDEDRDGLRLLRKLNDAATEWISLGREPGALYRGTRLAAVADWLAAEPNVRLQSVEREFIDASLAAHAAEREDERAATRRLRSLVRGLAAALVIALIAGIVAVWQRRDADHAATRAHRAAAAAESARLDTLARTLPDDQIDLAQLLAVENHRLFPSSTSEGSLEAALARTAPGLEQVLRFSAPSVFAGVSPDGRLLVAAGTDGQIRMYDLRSGALVRAFVGQAAQQLRGPDPGAQHLRADPRRSIAMQRWSREAASTRCASGECRPESSSALRYRPVARSSTRRSTRPTPSRSSLSRTMERSTIGPCAIPRIRAATVRRCASPGCLATRRLRQSVRTARSWRWACTAPGAQRFSISDRARRSTRSRDCRARSAPTAEHSPPRRRVSCCCGTR